MENIDINQMRQDIIADYNARIDKLKEEMKAELALLSRFASRFQKNQSIETREPLRRIRLNRRSEASEEGKQPTAKDRIMATKQKVTGRFTRKELWDAVNGDGFGEMKEGTFSPYVSRLIADRAIVEIEKAVGTTPSVYMWPEEYAQLPAEDLLATQQPDIFTK